jgi:hypothetical protein
MCGFFNVWRIPAVAIKLSFVLTIIISTVFNLTLRELLRFVAGVTTLSVVFIRLSRAQSVIVH